MTDDTSNDGTPSTDPTEPGTPEGSHAPSSPAAPAAPAGPEATPQPQAPYAPPHVRRLVRRRDNKIIGGVCAGLAAYLGADPVLIRIAFVLAAILGGGTGVLIYLVMWLVMPAAPEGEPLPPPASHHLNWERWTAMGVVVLGLILLSSNLWRFHGALVWGLILIGVGIALWGREFGPRGPGGGGWGTSNSARIARIPDGPIGSGTAPPGTPSAPTAPLASFASSTPPPTVPFPAPPTPPIPPPRTATASSSAPAPSPKRREPSVLGRLVVGAAALAVGLGVLLSNLSVLHVTPETIVAALLFIAGLGLVIGAFWGRARWLIFVGAGLALVLSAINVLPSNIHGGIGDVVWRPASLQEIQSSYQHGLGNATLDLTRVTFGPEGRNISLKIAAGNLDVVVPDGVPVTVHARATAGNLDLFGHETNGFDTRNTASVDGSSDIGRLVIYSRAGFGNTTVRRGKPGDTTLAPSDGNLKIDIGPGRLRVQTNGGQP